MIFLIPILILCLIVLLSFWITHEEHCPYKCPECGNRLTNIGGYWGCLCSTKDPIWDKHRNTFERERKSLPSFDHIAGARHRAAPRVLNFLGVARYKNRSERGPRQWQATNKPPRSIATPALNPIPDEARIRRSILFKIGRVLK